LTRIEELKIDKIENNKLISELETEI